MVSRTKNKTIGLQFFNKTQIDIQIEEEVIYEKIIFHIDFGKRDFKILTKMF